MTLVAPGEHLHSPPGIVGLVAQEVASLGWEWSTPWGISRPGAGALPLPAGGVDGGTGSALSLRLALVDLLGTVPALDPTTLAASD